MALSDELLHLYGKLDRPQANRDRSVPLVPSPDNRPLAGLLTLLAGFFVLFFVGGFALRLLWSL